MKRLFDKIEKELEQLYLKEYEIEHHKIISDNTTNSALKIVNSVKDKHQYKYVSREVLDQVRWERDIALMQLRELGYSLGQEIWVPVQKRLPEGCKDAEIEVLVTTYDNEYGYETHFALYYPDGNRFYCVYNRIDITENVIAWQYMPHSYKGEMGEKNELL